MFEAHEFYRKTSEGGHPNGEAYFNKGQIIHVVARTKSLALGECFIVEDANTNFVPVSIDIDTTIWKESNQNYYVELVKSQSE
jgi:hypothetical protein